MVRFLNDLTGMYGINYKCIYIYAPNQKSLFTPLFLILLIY